MQDEISIGSAQEQVEGDPVGDGRAVQRSLRIYDTKTRDTPTVPLERNSTQARTQLMLYHRLLSGHVQSSSGSELKADHLDFDVFWLRVGVDPYEPFSHGFCEQTGLSTDGSMANTSERQGSSVENEDTNQTHFCLNTLVDAWKKSIHLLGITSVDPTLTLNYRRRTTSGRKKRRRSDKGQMSSLEEKELDQAIVASLAQADHDDPALACAIAESLRDAGTTDNRILGQNPIQLLGSPSKRNAGSDPDESDLNSNKGAEEGSNRGSELIGSASFVMDDAALDSRLEKVLEWWHGIRLPEGVELEDTGRCQYVSCPVVAQRPADLFARSSCEFSTSCEWREKKHNELLSKLRSRTPNT